MGGDGIVASAFNALLSNVRDKNQAMASMAQARVGIVAAKERQDIQRAEQEIADKQLAEESRRARQEAKAKRKGTLGGFIGGLLAPAAAAAASITLGPLGMALAAGAGGYLGSKAGTELGGEEWYKGGKKLFGGVSYKYKPINEADISNLSSGYFYKPQREKIKYDIGRINTEGQSMEDIFDMAKEGVAQQMATSSALRAFGTGIMAQGAGNAFNLLAQAPDAAAVTTAGAALTEVPGLAEQAAMGTAPRVDFFDHLFGRAVEPGLMGNPRTADVVSEMFGRPQSYGLGRFATSYGTGTPVSW